MKTTLLLLIAAASAFAAPSFDFKLLDKLGANAKESTNLDLDSSVLKMAGGFLGNKGKDADSVRSLISGLKGIYIRSFEFDRPGKYNEADLEPLRTWLDAGHWSKIIDTKEEKEKSSIYVLPLPNDQFGGLAIISAEEQEVTVVFIDGQINPDDLGKLGGNMGIPDMSLLANQVKAAKDKSNDKKE